MKLIGSFLIMFGAAGGYFIYRRSATLTLRLLRALTEDLSVLRCQICIHRRSLPSILVGDLSNGLGGAFFWKPLAERLLRAEGTVSECWERTVEALPPLIAVRFAQIGRFLPIGGESLARVIDEVRNELLALTRDQQMRQSDNLRLSAAMCFSLAAFLILIFI